MNLIVAVFSVVLLQSSSCYASRRSTSRRCPEKDVTHDKMTNVPTFAMGQCMLDNEAALTQMKYVNDSRVICDDVGLCKCPNGMYFDGFMCHNIIGSQWENFVATLGKKWKQVPAVSEFYDGESVHRVEHGMPGVGNAAWSTDLLNLSDRDLEKFWDTITTQDTFTMFYASIFKGQNVLDFGSGLGRQTIQFAIHGANVTFVDVAASNLEIIRRVCAIKGVTNRIRTILLKSVKDLRANLEGTSFDVVCGFGSMHHAPREIIRQEQLVVLKHLKKGGTWLQLAYPLRRWIWHKEYGSNSVVPFSDGYWGGDGYNTPWAEWYEPGKLLQSLRPAQFYLKWCGIINHFEFIWMELTFLGM